MQLLLFTMLILGLILGGGWQVAGRVIYDFAARHLNGDDKVMIGDFNPAAALIAFHPDRVPGTRVLVERQPTAYFFSRRAAELAANGSLWQVLQQA